MKMLSKVLIFSLVVMVFITGCTSKNNSSEVKEVIIASLHPVSGYLAKEGQEMDDAIKMAADEINEAGGIKSLGGAKVKVITGDHEGSEEKALSETQRLIRDGALGIIGAYGTVLTATQEAEKQKTPFIIDVAVADEVLERGFKYSFRLQPNSTMMVNNFLKYFTDLNNNTQSGLKTAVLSYEDAEFGTGIAERIAKRADEAGLEIIGKIPHSAGAADFTPSVSKITSLKPDVVILTTYLNDGTQIMKGLDQNGAMPKLLIGVANGALSNPTFIHEETSINQNMLDVNYSINPKSDKAKQLKDTFKEKYNKDFGPNSAYAYEAAKVLLLAIEKAGSTDKDKIRDQISSLKYEDHILPQEQPVIFDETGQNPNAAAVLTQINGGESFVVYPEPFGVAEPVFPMNK
jgi:branched-chain amino acid transport system substrate-binding protein